MKVFCLSFLLFFGSFAVAETLLFPTDLRPGVKNQVAIIVLQKFLKAERYYEGPIAGIYDTMTVNAVRSFQVDHALVADGIFQGRTRSMANKMIQSQITDYKQTQKKLPVEQPKKQPEKKLIKRTPVEAADTACYFAGIRMLSGESKLFYRYPVAAEGGTCHSQKRTCDHGYLDGDPGFRHTVCEEHTKVQTVQKTAIATSKNSTTRDAFCFSTTPQSGTSVTLCAVAATEGRCSDKNHPCAYITADGQKACFAKVGDACPKVPKKVTDQKK